MTKYEQIITAFEPEKHGFRFGNVYSGAEVLAELTARGFLGPITELVSGFHALWPFGPILVREIGKKVAEIVITEEHWDAGLCGGMCFAALARYHADVPVGDDSTPPRLGDDLFRELVEWQFNSIAGPAAYLSGSAFEQVIVWQMIRPAHGHRGLLGIASTGKLTSYIQFRGEPWRRALRWRLKLGLPTPIMVITRDSLKPGDLKENHQVLVYGYTLDWPLVKLHIYDPNSKNTEDFLEFSLTGKDWRIKGKLGEDREYVKGFFMTRIPYPEKVRPLRVNTRKRPETLPPPDPPSRVWMYAD